VFVIVLSFHEGTLNVRSVKSRRNVLKYISKEDKELITNIRESELSFYYRTICWARRTQAFRYNDPFVLEHPQYYRLLQEVHKEVQSRQDSRSTAPAQKLSTNLYDSYHC
jgi:hypothetical protein